MQLIGHGLQIGAQPGEAVQLPVQLADPPAEQRLGRFTRAPARIPDIQQSGYLGQPEAQPLATLDKVHAVCGAGRIQPVARGGPVRRWEQARALVVAERIGGDTDSLGQLANFQRLRRL